MQTGKIKWFNPKKGYGFIIPQDSDRDVFFHVTSMSEGNSKQLSDGQVVSFEILEERGKTAASNVSITQ